MGVLVNSTRDQVFLRSFGSLPPTINPDAGISSLGRIGAPNPNVVASNAGAASRDNRLSEEIAKSYRVYPTDQGQRGAIAARQVMMIGPRDNPSRSQYSEGYTDPIQVFASSNVWNTQAGLSSKGTRASQPSTRFVSPFSNLPIPTRMPWDL